MRQQQQPKPSAARWGTGALVVAGFLLFALMLQWLRDDRPQSVDANDRAEKTTSRSSQRTHGRPGPATQSSVADPQLAEETPPWQATPQKTATLPPGTTPAWRVDPPPPDLTAPLPPPPTEPPNPAKHRPSIHNPGGVNADRSERPMPGLE